MIKLKLGFILLMTLFVQNSFSQTNSVSGTVLDDLGVPLPGVTILVQGTDNGTTTDFDGNYIIEDVKQTDQLLYTYLGMTSQLVTVGNKTRINITLKAEAEALDEIVVVGYGSTSTAKLITSVATVKSDEITQVAVSSVDQALQGRTPGVIVTNSGAPGSAPSVRIRGVGTVNTNDPLYVIDGVPAGSLETLNPNDIESMSVLKDASSAAIYGSRAANGVVIITTKSGKNGKVNFNFNTYVGFQEVWNTYDLLNTEQYLAYGRDLLGAAGTPVPPRFNDLGEFEGVETDWQEALFRDALITKTDLSVSAGSEKSSVYFGLEYFEQEGTQLGTGFERISARVNSTFELGRLKIGENITISKIDRQNETPSGGRTQILHALRSAPYIPVFDPSNPTGFAGADLPDGQDAVNPVLLALVHKNEDENIKFLGSAYAELELAKGLSFKTSLGVDISYGTNRQFIPSYTVGSNNTSGEGSSISQNRFAFISPLVNAQLLYDRKFGSHSVNFVGGVERQDFEVSTLLGSGQNILTNDVEELIDTKDRNTESQRQEETLISYFGRVNYDFDAKYLVGFSYRRDGSSKFGPNNRWADFIGLSAGWRIGQEQFLKNVDWVSDLKLKASIGEVGNNNIDNYEFQSVINGDFFYSSGTGSNLQLIQGSGVTQLANENIKWETTEMINLGISGAFFNNQLTFNAEYFFNETKDMLLRIPIPGSLGFDEGPRANVGNVENKGLEFELGFNQTINDFSWSINANISFVDNEVTRLSGSNPVIFGPEPTGRADVVTRTEADEPLAYFYGWKVDGIFQEGDDFSQQPGAQPGDIRFVDIEKDGIIDDKDKTNIGHFLPDFTYGFNASANYKNFDLTVFFQGTQGNEILNVTGIDLYGSDRLFNTGTRVLDRWTPTNTNTTEPRAIAGDPNRNTRISDRYVEDGSYLRLKTLTLGYSLDQALLDRMAKHIGLNKLRMYVTGQNLLTFTDYEGLDPEIASDPQFNGQAAASLTQGVDFGQYPQARAILFGIQAGF